jgi:polar amino acid transport system substrate-binding protein
MGTVLTEGRGVRLVERINLVTGDDYSPFTDRKLPQGGMSTELVQRAMEAAAPSEGFAIHSVNHCESHLDTLAPQGLIDGTFPWSNPPCDLLPDEYRRQTFLFSDPMFEILELAYVNKSRPILFDKDDDMIGKTLCRLAGYLIWELDQDGRNWLVDGKIKLERPKRVTGCFDFLIKGKVDAVFIDEFAGRPSLIEQGLADKVLALPRPINIAPLNVLVHKGNPRAQEIVDTINRGLKVLKDKGDYQEIIRRHLSTFWAGQ